jgi:hypothetical protein
MKVKEMIGLLRQADPNMEVLVKDYGEEFYAGVAATGYEDVYPYVERALNPDEPWAKQTKKAFVIDQTLGSMAKARE